MENESTKFIMIFRLKVMGLTHISSMLNLSHKNWGDSWFNS